MPDALTTEITFALRAAYLDFSNDPLEKFRVALRRERAKQLRHLLHDAETVELEVFNKEVWVFESAATVCGQDIKGKIFALPKQGQPPLTQEEVDFYTEALVQGELEFHGNSIWGSGSGVFAPTESDPDTRLLYLRQLLDALNDSTLTPYEKCVKMSGVKHCGNNTASGLVMVYHPTEFALFNIQSTQALKVIGLEVGGLLAFAKEAENLRNHLECPDYIELDWFLYLLAQGQINLESYAGSQEVPNSKEQPRYWWMNQGVHFAREQEGGYVWSPQRDIAGRERPQYTNVSRLLPGDVILHYDSALRNVSEVTHRPEERPRPGEDTNSTQGYFVQTKYTNITPVALEDIPMAWRLEDPSGPFNHVGGLKQSYLSPLSATFIANFVQKFPDRLPTSIPGKVSASVPVQLDGIPPSPRMVKIAPGANAKYWEDCLKGSYICVGWEKTGPLDSFANEAEFMARFEAEYADLYKDDQPMIRAKGKELWTLRELKPGDLIAANQGIGKILAVGTVQNPAYQYRPERMEFNHTVNVAWDTSLAKSIPQQGFWRFVTVRDIPTAVADIILGKATPTSGELLIGDTGDLTDSSDTSVTGESMLLEIPDYSEPDFQTICNNVHQMGLNLSDSLLRRYHLSLKTRGFVVLSGVSGTGKTWLTQAYANAVGAQYCLVAVAPNWNANEDLLGFRSPFEPYHYQDTAFSRFLRRAAQEYALCAATGRVPRPYHLVLDEMNLARVEYYFAKFLSAMELRIREGTAAIETGEGTPIPLTPNLLFIGTVNVDETTHPFADKVYDRAQLLMLEVTRESIEAHLGQLPFKETLLQIWDAVHPVAPFAFRVLDDIKAYVAHAQALSIPWEAAVDEQVLQKILPRLKGADLRLGEVLRELLNTLTVETFPLSHVKARQMEEGFAQHGFASYF